jgi:hypothetical protein
MYQVKMINGDTFVITDETFSALAGKSGLIYIPEISGIINLVSVCSILPKELAENINLRRKLHDGGYAINKFGYWYDEKDPNVKIDLNYYPELRKSEQENNPEYKNFKSSNFAKRLANGKKMQ